MEQREANVEVKAMSLIQEFVKKFRTIDYTLHPSDIPGEAAGKGSNVAWAARKLSQRYTMAQRKDVVITGIDGRCSARSLICCSLQQMFPRHHRIGPDSLTTLGAKQPIATSRPTISL